MSSAASSAKGPLIAGGAALAGVAGGIALSAARNGHGRKLLGFARPTRPKVKISSRDVARTAKELGTFGEQLGSLANEIRQTREAVAGGAGRHRSPIEVLLQGLTSRR